MAIGGNFLLLAASLALCSKDVVSGLSYNMKGTLQIQPESIMVMTGERIYANCSSNGIPQPFAIRWQLYNSGNSSIHQKPLYSEGVSNGTKALVINNARLTDSGLYMCVLVDAQGQVFSKYLNILVTNKTGENEVTASSLIDITYCPDNMFECDDRIKIFCRYRCNGKVDCPNGADEKGCPNTICVGKFRCNNSRCIDYIHVCDDNHENNCWDWSDEDRCGMGSVITDSDASDSQMAWLKTTVYTVIACTVGVVILISIIVIAIFRIKMKRAAMRRAYLQAERRRRHQQEAHSSQMGHHPLEQEPFISPPTTAHFGNIIVSLNNSIQYVPNTDVTAHLPAPPSYSDVIAETRQGTGRHSPPPEYSTIDRNPNRSNNADTCFEINQQTSSNPDTCLVSRSEHTTPTDSSSVYMTARGDNTHPVISHSVSDAAITSPAVTCTNSLGRQSCYSTNMNRNVRLAGSQQHRPKQLQVRGGQIVLEGLSANPGSSPDEGTRNPQTNSPGVRLTGQPAGKPCQIQVHGGQIVLAAENCGLAEVGGAGQSTSSTPGQLEVTDGQIMFKAS